jgi:hypothetical protein
MTDETTEAARDEGGEDYSFSFPNPQPQTAEGVAALLEATRQHVEDKSYARAAMVLTGDGTAIPAILTPDGSYKLFTPSEMDAYTDAPRFRRGTATLTSLDSFIAHINRFGDSDSAVFACDNHESPSLTAVLDYHRIDTLNGEEQPRVHGDYRHGKHRSRFAFPVSDQWKAWNAGNGNRMGMADFAVFLEDNVLDVADVEAVPESAKRFVEMNGGAAKIADWSILNKLAKSLTIYENAVVTEAVNLSSGEGQLTLKADHDTEVAGVKATIPTMFFVAIPIFREGVVYRLPVRLRYRKSGAGFVFWYELWRADRAFDDAFREAVAKVDAETEAQVFFGSPEA